MTKNQWELFCDFRDEFKQKIHFWNKQLPFLAEIQRKTSEFYGIPKYNIENPIVYNSSLDDFTKNDEIKLIVIGDNPGKDEQLNQNQKYLVGLSGKIATGFFAKNSELNIDFRKNVIILNKTPIHSAKTIHLKKMVQFAEKSQQNEFIELISETQIWMAKKTADFQSEFNHLVENSNQNKLLQIWLVGYSELKNNGIFTDYKTEFVNCYKNYQKDWENVYVFQHFSMNRFSIDLNDFRKNKNISLKDAIQSLGKIHKNEIFGI